MTLLLQFSLLAVVLAIFVAGPYLVGTRLAIVRGAAHRGKAGRNVFGLRAEPRFYGLLSIFVAVLPATLIALVGLGVYVPQAEKSVTGDVIAARLQSPLGVNDLGLDETLTYAEFLALPVRELGFFGTVPHSQLKNTLQVAEDCVAQAAKVMAANRPIAQQPPCLEAGFALNFFQGLGEARLIAEDRIVNRTYLAILLAALFGLACSALVSVPALRARQMQEWTTLGLLALASLVAILAMIALIFTLLGNTLGFMRFGQTYDYGGPLRLPDWAQRHYAGIDMAAVNRWSKKIEPQDYLDFDAVAQVLIDGTLVLEQTIALDARGQEFVADSREKWQVTLDDQAVNLGLSIRQLDFITQVQARGGNLGEKDVRRLLPFAPQLIAAFLDEAAFEAAQNQADARLAEATQAARARTRAFIGANNTLSPAYLETYAGFDIAPAFYAGPARHEDTAAFKQRLADQLDLTQFDQESQEAYQARKLSTLEVMIDDMNQAQRRYASRQRTRAFIYFEDLSDSQRRWHWLKDFFSWDYKPGAANSAEEPSHRFGVLAIFYGTFAIGTIALLVSVPLGLLAAIFVSQFATRSFKAVAKPTLEVLAGIPTIVYGYFALLAVAPFVQSGFTFFEQNPLQWVRELYNSLPLETPQRRMALVAGLVMGFMLIPFISSTTEDALAAVPKGMKDGALALGSTKSESLLRVQFFAALPGIVGGVLLAISRAIGETMIVFVAAGATPNSLLTLNPLASQTTATVIIANRFGGAEDSEGTGVVYMAFTIGFVLLLLTLILNLAAIFVVRRFRARYE